MSQVRKDVLNGWKEIAAYLGRDPRTVERWEKQRSLPVRRLPGSGRATVYALVSELDAWLASPIKEPDPFPVTSGQTLGTVRGTTPPAPEFQAVAPAIASSETGELSISAVPTPAVTAAHGTRGFLALCLTMLVILCGFGADQWLAARRSTDTVAPPRRTYPSSRVPGVDELYFKASYQAELRTSEALRRAQEGYLAAIGKDPQFASAYAGLASTFLLLREYSTVPDAEAYRRAVEAANKALALDPDLPQAHAVLGFADFFWEWDARAARAQFQQALRLDAGLPLTHHWYGSMLVHEGRFQDGLRELNLAQQLDPSSSAIMTTRAFALGLGGRRDEATDLLNVAISTEHAGQYRNPVTMHQVLASLCLLSPRDIPRFLSESLLAAELREDTQTVQLMSLGTRVYQAQGEQAMWQALLSEERSRHTADGPTFAMARYEAELGARTEAVMHLQTLYARHDPALMGLYVDPLLAPLTGDPRIQHLGAAMGFPSPDRK